MNLDELNSQFAIDQRLRFQQDASGLIQGCVATDECRGSFFLQGAQVTHFQPTSDEHSWLFLSRQATLAEKTPIRGGIPICFPWFGPHRSDPTAPSHGLVRTKTWKCLSSQVNDGAIVVTLELVVGLFQLHFVLSMSQSLTVALSIRNLAELAQSCEVALHTYFAISNIHDVSILGLERLPFLDQLTGVEHGAEVRPIAIAAETDRIYQGVPPTIQLVDPGWDRTLSLSSRCSRSTVVWNPWIAKSQRLADFGDDEYLQMCCIETANIGEHAVHLESSERQTVAVTISSDNS